MATGYDLTLDGVSFRVVRGSDEAPNGYQESFQRAQTGGQELINAPGSALDSRQDRKHFYQTTWVGGSRWEKPLLTAETANTYFTARGLDPTFRGGDLTPANKVYTHALSSILPDDTKMISVEGETYIVGSTTITDATNLDIYSWDSATNTFTRETAFTSGGTGTDIRAMTYDPEQGTGTVYVMRETNSVTWFKPAGSSGNVTTVAVRPGSNLFMHNGTLVAYTGAKLQTIDDPLGTPALTDIADDGMGKDWLAQRLAVNPILRTGDIRLAIGTSDGIYYVKNVESGGLPVAWVFRVDRDSTGVYINTPVATLPPGSVAVSLAWHLGSLVIAAIDDYRAIYENNITTSGHLRVSYYHYTNPNFGLLGVPLGDAATIDETPAMILGALGPVLYLGGLKRIWGYDAVQGGLHPLFEEPGSETDSTFKGWAQVEDSDGDTRDLFLHTGGHLVSVKRRASATDLTTVATFGTDLTTYVLESNVINFSLPLELKTLTNIQTLVDGSSANSQYLIQVSVDGGAFVTRHTATFGFAETDLSSLDLTGYNFRYKVIHESKTATLSQPLKELKIQATSGEFVRVWDLYIDGTYSHNIENELQNPESVYDTLFALYSQPGHIEFVPSFANYEQDDTTAYQVKVNAVRTAKSDPGESVIHVQLVGT